jgi:iron complex outermembrane receptor protein
MPPPRLGASLRRDDGALSLGGDVHHELRQDRVGAADEPPTPAHTLLRLHAGLRVTRGGAVHSLSLRAENLGDAVHREATSRVKDFAPGPGRNLSLVYRVFF